MLNGIILVNLVVGTHEGRDIEIITMEKKMRICLAHCSRKFEFFFSVNNHDK